MLTQKQLEEIKIKFKEKIISLERDSYRSFTEKIEIDPSLGSGKSFFPITLYCMCQLDYFSGIYFGYLKKGNDKVRIDQTTRMVEFACKYLKYDSHVSRIAIDIFRHKLVHLGEPHTSGKGISRWEIANDCAIGDHWTIQSYNLRGNKKVIFGVNDFIRNLKNAIFGGDGYYKDFLSNNILQQNYLNFLKEVS